MTLTIMQVFYLTLALSVYTTIAVVCHRQSLKCTEPTIAEEHDQKYKTRVKVADSYKHARFVGHSINYSIKSFIKSG